MSGATSEALTTLRARWAGLSARERQGVTLAAVVVGLALLWVVAVQPAWRTVRSAPAQQAQLDAAWQRMQRDAAEAKRLRALPPVAPALAAQTLQAATTRLGDAGKLSLQGERAVLTLTEANGDAIAQWLAEVRRGARARAIEARLEAAGDGYSGRITVAIGGGA
ncbi:type II secretion system protein GspM [Rubrivivax albus]|uniref:Type II secretion system protein M n=1 Tax=Rubrivivax albus TaxID=2499835 RepID=A0A3S2TSB4_9BURK|nr:type II secretion system protein GspM [Rubrivivax albus]RVT53397.1 type II secretion system protein M [Rubrivivax albus]